MWSEKPPPMPNPSLKQTEQFLTRRLLAERWKMSCESVKRRQKAGLLHPIYLSKRKLLYKLSEVEALEAAAAGSIPWSKHSGYKLESFEDAFSRYLPQNAP
jgi:hypothetical protein